ncbi:hypothetical protein MRX96_001260 [Rhipicephalus microplus]
MQSTSNWRNWRIRNAEWLGRALQIVRNLGRLPTIKRMTGMYSAPDLASPPTFEKGRPEVSCRLHPQVVGGVVRAYVGGRVNADRAND